ncbi:MAG: hypothetical protein LBR41_01415 [Rickettsiales bacterium]|jgi:hypothetical protein|nr:hypothetical protein [Rickettsiales bacterium]
MMNEQDAQKRIAALLMSDMPLKKTLVARTPYPADWYPKSRTVLREFMQSLDDSITALSMLTLDRDTFFALLGGRALPENLSAMWRVPLSLGGKISADNLFLCQTFPYRINLDRFIAEQAGAPVVFLPNPAGKIYIPTASGNAGPGGATADDRLSQMAAAMVGARDI